MYHTRSHPPHLACRTLCSAFLALVVFFSISLPTHAASAGLMDLSADGELLACSNRDSGTVSIVDLKTNKKLREVKVGQKPEGVAFLGKTRRLAVAVYHDDKVVFVDADAGKVVGETDVEDEPYGVVSSPDGAVVYVSLSYPGKVVEIDAKSYKVNGDMSALPFSRGLALSADGARLFVTGYYSAEVIEIDIAAAAIKDRWPALASDNLSRQVVLHPTRAKAYLPHIRSATERAHGEGSIFPYISVLDTRPPKSQGEKRRTRIPMDSFVGVHVTANPWEADISPDGKKFYIAFSGTYDLYVCDVLDDDYREIRWRSTLQMGNNPRAVRVSRDSSRFYVYNALDFNVVAYDAGTNRKVAEIPVTDNPLADDVLQGKKLFYSALQPMVGRRWISCSSCHPDGETDGRTWQNPEGLRDTPPLAAMAWTHPLHWSADRDEVQDFEHTIRGNLMQGRGLVRNRVHADLGPPNKGLSRDLDALAAYSNTHTKVPISPHAKKGLSESAKRGQEIFNSKSANCASCHSGPYYTDSTPGSTIIRHDVGTGKDDPSELMGPKYDTPTLLGVYKSAPYLHHGKAATLRDVLTTQNKADTHGKTSHLTAAQLDDLVEFLQALPFEDPEPKAIELKMKKVER